MVDLIPVFIVLTTDRSTFFASRRIVLVLDLIKQKSEKRSKVEIQTPLEVKEKGLSYVKHELNVNKQKLALKQAA